ncbi:MAG: uroporphyrinogen decarboxylase family protein [Lentisphaeria bacterium]
MVKPRKHIYFYGIAENGRPGQASDISDLSDLSDASDFRPAPSTTPPQAPAAMPLHLPRPWQLTAADHRRLEALYARYRRQWDTPAASSPMFVIDTPAPVAIPTWEERLADPALMLQTELDLLRPHLELGDDQVPTVRVEFGTAQVAAAFGCRLVIPPNSQAAAASHVLNAAEDVAQLRLPGPDAGWYGKLREWTQLWQEVLPDGLHLQHPDIQSAFNTAHLIRGNDILMDFYDAPDAVDRLLDLVTDYMLQQTRRLNAMIGAGGGWFFDWGAMWRGAARISNCSMHMISPKLYLEHVYPRDVRFLREIGGGRIHYCGATPVIPEFLQIPGLSGLDFDASLHDLWTVAEQAPPQVTLCVGFGNGSAGLNRLLAGDWPRKRNLIIRTQAASPAAARTLLSRLRHSVPGGCD